MNMIQLTRWTRPNVLIETTHGDLPGKEWLELEAERIASNPKRTVEIRETVWSPNSKRDKMLALFVNPICSFKGCRKVAVIRKNVSGTTFHWCFDHKDTKNPFVNGRYKF